MTKDELSLIIAKLDTIYDKKNDPKKVDAYMFALGNQSRFRVLQACMAHITLSEWYPKPRDLLKLIYNQIELEKIKKGKEIIPSKFDEACHWIMFYKGITDPGELTEEDINKINAKFCIGNEPIKDCGEK